MEVALVMVAAIACYGFLHWLRHQRRVMIHRERLAAIEKGTELPPLDQEVRRSSWNVQRILLLCGLVWMSLGLATFLTLAALFNHASEAAKHVPRGLEMVGLAPFLIGVSHLVVYQAGKKREG